MAPTQVYSNLYVGDIEDVREGDTSEFDRVVGVCQDDCSENVSAPYHHFNLADGPNDEQERGEFSYELFSNAVDRVIAERIARQKVLVHCHAGVSRSVAVATATLAVLHGHDWDEAFGFVKDARPIANPKPELISAGKRYINEKK